MPIINLIGSKAPWRTYSLTISPSAYRISDVAGSLAGDTLTLASWSFDGTKTSFALGEVFPSSTKLKVGDVQSGATMSDARQFISALNAKNPGAWLCKGSADCKYTDGQKTVTGIYCIIITQKTVVIAGSEILTLSADNPYREGTMTLSVTYGATT